MQSNTQPGSLGNKFQHLGAAPTDALWGRVEAALDEKENKRSAAIWWWTGGTLAATILLLIVVNLHPGSSSGSNEANIGPGVDAEKTVDTSQDLNESTEQIRSNEIASDQMQAQKDNTDLSLYKNSTSETNEETLVLSEDNNQSVNERVASVDQTERLELLNHTGIPLLSYQADVPEFHLAPIKKQKRRPWEVGFNVGYWQDASSLGMQKNMELADFNDPGTGTLNIPGYQAEALNGNDSPLGSGSAKKNVNISGFVGKYFSERWSWRVGIDYTRTTFVSNYYTNQLALNYPDASGRTALNAIGIPVSLQYDFIKRPIYKLRGSLSVINEIPLLERIESNGVSDAKFVAGYMNAVQIGLMNDIKVGKNLFISMTPAYRFYTTQTVKSDLPLIKKSHWLGANIGLTWEL